MGIIVRNLSSNGLSNVRFGNNSIVPFSFDASLLNGSNSIGDIIVGDGSGLSNVTGTYNLVEGVEDFKYVQFTNSMFVFNFDCENPILTNKKFRSKSYQFIPSTSSYYFHYGHNIYSYNNRLLYGMDISSNQNVAVWNNQQFPRLNSGDAVHIGKWCEIVWEYNNGVWRYYVDAILRYTGSWTIRNYSKVNNFITSIWWQNTRLRSYRIQIEGINWSGNFNESW